MIMKYTIISGFEPEFTEQVNAHINKGWQPYGTLIRDPYSCYYQAMVLGPDPRTEKAETYKPNYHLLREGL